jgi:hypothetical protein
VSAQKLTSVVRWDFVQFKRNEPLMVMGTVEPESVSVAEPPATVVESAVKSQDPDADSTAVLPVAVKWIWPLIGADIVDTNKLYKIV